MQWSGWHNQHTPDPRLLTWTGWASRHTMPSPSLSHTKCTSRPAQPGGMLSSTLNQHVSHLEESRQHTQPTARPSPEGSHSSSEPPCRLRRGTAVPAGEEAEKAAHKPPGAGPNPASSATETDSSIVSLTTAGKKLRSSPSPDKAHRSHAEASIRVTTTTMNTSSQQ